VSIGLADGTGIMRSVRLKGTAKVGSVQSGAKGGFEHVDDVDSEVL